MHYLGMFKYDEKNVLKKVHIMWHINVKLSGKKKIFINLTYFQ